MAITTSWDANTMHSGNYNIIVFFIIVFSVLVLIFHWVLLKRRKSQSCSFAAKKKIHFQLFSYDEYKDLNKCKMTLRSHKNMHMQVV